MISAMTFCPGHLAERDRQIADISNFARGFLWGRDYERNGVNVNAETFLSKHSQPPPSWTNVMREMVGSRLVRVRCSTEIIPNAPW